MITHVQVQFFDEMKDNGVPVGRERQWLNISVDEDFSFKETPALEQYGLAFDRKSMERAIKSAINTGKTGDILVSCHVPTSDLEANRLAQSMSDYALRRKSLDTAMLKREEWIAVLSIHGKASGFISIVIRGKPHLVFAGDMLVAMENLGR